MNTQPHSPTPEILEVQRRSAGLPVSAPEAVSPDDLERINALAPAPLRNDQVYVRSMYLCSDRYCASDGCRFTVNALQQIARLIVGQAVLMGHNRSTLPLARFFKAAVVTRTDPAAGEPAAYVRAWFYWLRDTSGAQDLRLNIDGGVYREVSLAWRFSHWRCSICGSENGRCRHRPGERYDNALCCREIDEVQEVLEGSLVYKGADQNTVLARMASAGTTECPASVYLICAPDDPLLSRLEALHLLGERCPLSSGADALQGTIQLLWVRSAAETEAEALAYLLAPDGLCLQEVPGVQDTPSWSVFHRRQEQWLRAPLPEARP